MKNVGSILSNQSEIFSLSKRKYMIDMSQRELWTTEIWHARRLVRMKQTMYKMNLLN